MELSDEQLYNRIRMGDRRALAELYERREPALYRYGLQLCGNRAMAEEAVQEAFLGLIQGGARFDASRGSLEAYLYGAVRNLVRVANRSQVAEGGEEPAADDDVLRTLMGDEMTAALYTAVRELPEPYRDVVALCDLEERSYEDAARLLGSPVGTIRSRLHRARRLLAEKRKHHTVVARRTGR